MALKKMKIHGGFPGLELESFGGGGSKRHQYGLARKAWSGKRPFFTSKSENCGKNSGRKNGDPFERQMATVVSPEKTGMGGISAWGGDRLNGKAKREGESQIAGTKMLGVYLW